jgi:hypothetical protein
LPDIGSQGLPERYQRGAGRPKIMVRVSQRFGLRRQQIIF